MVKEEESVRHCTYYIYRGPNHIEFDVVTKEIELVNGEVARKVLNFYVSFNGLIRNGPFWRTIKPV